MPTNYQPQDGQSAPVMQEDAPAPGGADQQQTAEIPMAVFGDKPPKEGDTCTFKVVAVNADSGSVTMAYMAQDEPEGPGGTDGMAAEFDRAKMQQKGM